MLKIIIPAYNARETLPDLLDSIVAQTFKDFEVVISQDADQSEYEDIIKTYKKRGLRIKLIKSDVNGGPGVARQRGIDYCDIDDHAMFADADDIFNPRAAQILYSEAKRTDADMIMSDFIQESKKSGDQYLHCDQIPCTWMHGRIYKIRFLRENNIRFLDNLRLNEDAYFNFVITNSSQKVFKIQECTYIWKDYEKSLTRENGADGFFKKSWDGFILSQVKGMQKILDITGALHPETFARTMVNLFEAHMKALHYGLDDSKCIEYLSEIKTNDKLQELYVDTKFWDAILKNAKTGIVIEGTMVFFGQRICDWLQQYVARPQEQTEA